MATVAKLRPEFKEFEVGFKGFSGKLGEAKQKDLQRFYDMAHKAKRDEHLEMFEGHEPDSQSNAASNDTSKEADFNKKQLAKQAPGTDAIVEGKSSGPLTGTVPAR